MSPHVPPPSRPSHAPVEYPMPDAAQALFQGLITVISRLYWNREQNEWDQIQDPGIPGLLWAPYDWHDDTPDASAPNFVFREAPAHLHGMEIRWYKHPGRGLTCSKNCNYTQWGEWYDACLAHLTQYEAAMDTDT